MTTIDRVILRPGDLNNLGDLALLFQCCYGLRLLDPLKNAKFFVSVWKPLPPEIIDQLQQNAIEVLSGKSVPAILRQLPRSLHVWSGGQLVRNNTSIASLAVSAITLMVGGIVGAKSAVIGCGVSALSPKYEALYRRIFRDTLVFAARDRVSFERAQALVPSNRCVLTEDLIHFDGPIRKLFRPDADRPEIIIAPCQDESEARYIDTRQLSALVKRASQNLNVDRVNLVSHDIRSEMDPAVCDMIEKELTREGIPCKAIVTPNIENLISYYRSSRLVVTNRLHSVFFGLLSKAAVIILDDGNPKLTQAAERFSIPIIKVGELSPSALDSVLESAMAQSEDSRISALLRNASEKAQMNFAVLGDALSGLIVR